MVTTPSGLTLSEAEKLSKQQQAQILAGVPNEGGFFQMSAGEGANRLYQMRGGNIVGLGFNYPDDWQGRTIGSFLSEQTSKGIAGLGLSNVPTVNVADVQGLISQGRLKETGISDLQQFISSSQAYIPTDTNLLTPPENNILASPTTSGFDINAFNQQMVGATPTGVSYANLENRDGTIYNTQTGKGYATNQELATDLGIPADQINWAQITPKAVVQPVSPEVPEAIVPEDNFAGVRSVFGADWNPAPIFTSRGLIDKGIYGAVRIAGTNEVYTIGPGGGHLSAEAFREMFGTDDQEGIVGEVTREQAIALGITDTGQTPVATAGITTETLAPGGDIIELPGVSDTSPTSTITIGAEQTSKSIQDYIKMLQGEQTQTETDLDSLMAEFTGSLVETEGRGAAQLAAEEAQGVQTKIDALTSVNNQILKGVAEVNALTADYQLQNQIVEGKPISLGRMQGQQAQNYKMYLAQKNSMESSLGLLEAQALGLQGELTHAQNAANRAVDIKYADITTRLENQATLIDLLQGKISKEKQIRANAINLYLQDQQTVLAEQKTTEKAVYNTLLNQMQKYPDAQVTLQDTIEQANAKVVANSRIYQNQVRLTGTGGGGGGGGEDGVVEDPLSLNQIDIFARRYGWTPPLGFTESQLIQYMEDNPNATPEQLEAGANQAQGGGETPEAITIQTNFPDTVGHIMNTMTDAEMDAIFQKAKTAGVTQFFRGKRNDVQAYIETFESQIEEAVNAGYSKDEIKQHIFGTLGL